MIKFHVVDDSSRRRARVSHQLIAHGYGAEIYESLREFSARAPTEGVLLGSNDIAGSILRGVQEGEITIPVALYAERPAISDIVDAIAAGAIDFIEWPMSYPALARLLERLLQGSSNSGHARKRAQALELIRSLTKREREVLALIAQGGSSKSIADELGLSFRTVEVHRAKMLKRLAAVSTADAVRIAIYAGLDTAIDLKGRAVQNEEFDLAM